MVKTEFGSRVSKMLAQLLFENQSSAYKGSQSYNPPNTMGAISDHGLALILGMKPREQQVYLRCYQMLKRNTDASLACWVKVRPSDFSHIISRVNYYKAIKVLNRTPLITFEKQGRDTFAVVNPRYMHKLYKTKIGPSESIATDTPINTGKGESIATDTLDIDVSDVPTRF